jgi:hypothetical protein
MHGQQDAFTDELQRRIRKRFQVKLLLRFHAKTQGNMLSIWHASSGDVNLAPIVL